jgi:hypothetical protein
VVLERAKDPASLSSSSVSMGDADDDVDTDLGSIW